MKTYSIGREPTCNIVLYDPQKVISRHHATLTVGDNGRITIIDQSTNGTYVNGIRITSNAPVPVTRKDQISFAHVADLDWNLVDKGNSVTKYVLFGIGGAILVALLVWLGVMLANRDNGPVPINAGSTGTEQVEGTEKAEKENPDEKKDDKNANKEDEKKNDKKEEKENGKSEKQQQENKPQKKQEKEAEQPAEDSMPDLL